MSKKLFTVGHSNLSVEVFITLLQEHGVTALADVRSHPYSRYLPHFNQAALKTALLDAGIRYVFLGRELGARPSDPVCYVDGKALYENIAASESFCEGIQRVLKGSENYTTALMCAEKDPITCHRAILVCQHLREFELDINHILRDGSLEMHQQLEDRLLDLHGLSSHGVSQTDELELGQLSLFSDQSIQQQSVGNLSREESLKEAYRRQGGQIAYVERKGSHHEQVS